MSFSPSRRVSVAMATSWKSPSTLLAVWAMSRLPSPASASSRAVTTTDCGAFQFAVVKVSAVGSNARSVSPDDSAAGVTTTPAPGARLRVTK